MAAAAARLRGRRDRASTALGAALRATALGRVPADERAWLDRIDIHRRRLPAATVAASRAAPDRPERDPSEWLAEASRACQWMSLPPILGRLLTRLVRELSPRSCLELGTGFGISTAYQAAALELNGAGRMVSLDVAEMTEIAAPGLSELGLAQRIDLIPGLIEETLEDACVRAAPIDYALLDADHTEAGTLAAFDAIHPALSENALVVLDDINWTDGMRRAWRVIGEREGVGAAISLRRLGIAIVAGGAERAP